MAWTCIRADSFDKAFSDLKEDQRKLAKKTYNSVFKHNPFDEKLRSHKIHKLSSRYKKTIFGAVLDGNLRIAFYKAGPNTVVSVDIGTHDIYK